MSREIYTYTDLQNLGHTPYWNKLRTIPQITISADLQKSLKGSVEYDRVDGIFKDDPAVQVCEIRKLIDAAFPNWRTDETKFQASVVLSQFIRNQIERNRKNEKICHWLRGCQRNILAVLQSIMSLEEAAVEPEKLEFEEDKNIQFLVSAWKFLRKQEPFIDHFHRRIKELEEVDSWSPIFQKLFGKSQISAIIFHGFYNFTPIQERIVRLLEQSGISIIYLFSYNEKAPYANEIWRNSYSEKNGFPPQSQWHMAPLLKADFIGELFEGKQVKLDNQLKIKEYGTVMDFVYDIKKSAEEGYYICSSNSMEANEILRDFYPDNYGERNLLAYPIGQFISILNKLWNEEKKAVILEPEQLIELFSSGWLSFQGISGKQYLKDLMYLLPFFESCRTAEEWEKQMEKFWLIRESLSEGFHQDLDPDDSIARWQEIQGNPFLNFSFFAVEKEKAELILKLIEQVLSMAKELFQIPGKIRIRDHIYKLDLILKCHELSNELYQEEMEILQELFEKLSDSSQISMECYPSDISSALSLYLSGKYRETELHDNKIGMVSPLYFVDAVCIKQHGKVHICFCDSAHMPGGKQDYPWPLTEKLLKQYYKMTKNPLIKKWIDMRDFSAVCNRYFLYSGLKNPDVQLSWIRDYGDKKFSPSPYISLICEASGVKVTPPGHHHISRQMVEYVDSSAGFVVPYQVQNMPANTAKEAKMDYAICPFRYVLGYLVEKFPSFQNPFHQNYAVNGLIAAVYSLMKDQGVTIDQVYQNVMELFPHMRKAEKRQVYDYVQYQGNFSDQDYENFSETGNRLYTEERLKVSFPNQQVRNYALECYGRLLTPDGTTGINFSKSAATISSDPYKKAAITPCLFCQHQSYCHLAVFAADQEDLYD